MSRFLVNGFILSGVAANPNVLLVVGNPASLTTDDTIIKSRLESAHGASVTVVDDADTPSVSGYSAIVISPSAGAGNLAYYKDVPVGLVSLNVQGDSSARTWDLLDILDSTGVQSGLLRTVMRITNDSHPIITACGFSLNQDVQVYTQETPLLHTYPDDTNTTQKAVKLGANANYPSTWSMFVISHGDIDASGQPSASDRVQLFVHPGGITYLSSNGLALFDASISWVRGLLGDSQVDVRIAALYGPVQEWSLVAAGQSAPFDVIATATFSHADETITTELFYDENDTYKFRFYPTRLGVWTFSTSSSVAALDGFSGTVEVVPNGDPEVIGSYLPSGKKMIVPVGSAGDTRGVSYQIFVDVQGNNAAIDNYSTNPTTQSAEIDAAIDLIEDTGFNAGFVGVFNNWFQFGARSYDQHSSANPDPYTFRLLEEIINRAWARGIGIHIWCWGDETLKLTPIGVGGINGTADRRLQRYIAARLGPVPGWTMAYGYDLHEWMTETQLRSWYDYVESRMGWTHLLTGREQQGFDLGTDPLNWRSNDIRPLLNGTDIYQDALNEFAKTPARPVLFERRFGYLRDGNWTMDETRKALWKLSLAGGAAAIWGIWFDINLNYPNPEQIINHREFWKRYFHVDLVNTSFASSTYRLASADGSRVIAYGINTNQLVLPVVAGGTAIAIDTLAGTYTEIPLSPPSSGTWTWTAPGTSDWAIAFFPS